MTSMNPPVLTTMMGTQSMPISVASSSTITTWRSRSKKRPKTDELNNISSLLWRETISQPRCTYCSITWSNSISTSTIAKHLLNKHHINSTSQTNDSNIIIQPLLDTSKILLLCTLGKKFDCSIIKYVVSKILSHTHVESKGFRKFMHDVLSSYQMKSTPYSKTFNIANAFCPL